jgi:anti-sigma factor RsiW
MDKEREIIHKILDNDATDEEKRIIAQSMENDPSVREEINGLLNTVRMLEESERHVPPSTFTADVMKKLAGTKPSMIERMRGFLFGYRLLRWNMATALAAIVIVVAAAVMLARFTHEPPMTALSTPGENEVTVRLTFQAPQARSVAVAGDFNKWRTNADEMHRSDGMWSIDLKLKPGVYTYSFVIDGKSWVPDPGAETYQDDGFGSRNAVLRVNI